MPDVAHNHVLISSILISAIMTITFNAEDKKAFKISAVFLLIGLVQAVWILYSGKRNVA